MHNLLVWLLKKKDVTCLKQNKEKKTDVLIALDLNTTLEFRLPERKLVLIWVSISIMIVSVFIEFWDIFQKLIRWQHVRCYFLYHKPKPFS